MTVEDLRKALEQCAPSLEVRQEDGTPIDEVYTFHEEEQVCYLVSRARKRG